MRFPTLIAVVASAALLDLDAVHAQPTIRWQPQTVVLIQRGADYGRMARLRDDAILCVYTRRSAIYVRRSDDNGKTWSPETLAVDYRHGKVTNAELLVLRSGRILLLFNERPSDGKSPYAIGICMSSDDGYSWHGHRQIFTAGIEFENGCWEPAAVELPSGEIQLFFANEAPYRTSAEQQITRIRSLDGGDTWLEPLAVSFRPGHRDGMPVPLLLDGGQHVALAIEDNGLAGRFKPVTILLSTTAKSHELPIGPDDRRRRRALTAPLPTYVYAGAPYLVRLPSGETILSVQSTEGRGEPHDLTNARMVVYVGDATAHHFTNRSIPFEPLTDSRGLWNALFVKDADTVTAISSTTVQGDRGLWAIDGQILREP